MRILVTGASGFLGRAIVAAGSRAGHTMVAASRSGEAVPGAAEVQASGDLLASPLALDWRGVDAGVHCAARVHVTRNGDARADEAAHQVMNADLPVKLAKDARDNGARGFIQISSVAALASRSAPGETVTDADTPRPSTPYGRAKLAADEALGELAQDGFAVTSLRPPAIYGPGVGAFFAKLARVAKWGLPLPLGGIDNRRSFAFVGNVADAVMASLGSLRSGSFIVTDSLPISTAALYRKLLEAAGHGDRVWSVPEPLVRIPARMLLGDRVESLLGDAAFDGGRFARTFDWQARVPTDEALRLTMTAEAQG